MGTNACDAEETTAALAEDLRAGLLRERGEPIDALLAERNLNVVIVEGWRAIDGHEVERGCTARRARVKLASRDELLTAAR